MKPADYFTLTAANEAAKSVDLPSAPTNPAGVVVDVFSGGGTMRYAIDFHLFGNTLSWAGGPFDGALAENDEIRVGYF